MARTFRRQAPTILPDTRSESNLDAFASVLTSFGSIAAQKEAAKVQREKLIEAQIEEKIEIIAAGGEVDFETFKQEFGEQALTRLNDSSNGLEAARTLVRDIETKIDGGSFSGDVFSIINEYKDNVISEELQNKDFRNGLNSYLVGNSKRIQNLNTRNLKSRNKFNAKQEFIKTTQTQYDTITNNPDFTPEQKNTKIQNLFFGEARDNALNFIDNKEYNDAIFEVAQNLQLEGVDVKPLLDALAVDPTRKTKEGVPLKGLSKTDDRFLKLQTKGSLDFQVNNKILKNDAIKDLETNGHNLIKQGLLNSYDELFKKTGTKEERVQLDSTIKSTINNYVNNETFSSVYRLISNPELLRDSLGGKDKLDADVLINSDVGLRNLKKAGLLTPEHMDTLNTILTDPTSVFLQKSDKDQEKTFNQVLESAGAEETLTFLSIDESSNPEDRVRAQQDLLKRIGVAQSLGTKDIVISNLMDKTPITSNNYNDLFNAYKFIKEASPENLSMYVSKAKAREFELYQLALEQAVTEDPTNAESIAKTKLRDTTALIRETGVANVTELFVTQAGGRKEVNTLIDEKVLGEGEIDRGFFSIGRDFNLNTAMVASMKNEILNEASTRYAINPNLDPAQVIDEISKEKLEELHVAPDSETLIALPTNMRDDVSREDIDNGYLVIAEKYDTILTDMRENPQKYNLSLSEVNLLKDKESAFGLVPKFVGQTLDFFDDFDIDLASDAKTEATGNYNIKFKNDSKNDMNKLWGNKKLAEKMEAAGLKRTYNIQELLETGRNKKVSESTFGLFPEFEAEQDKDRRDTLFNEAQKTLDFVNREKLKTPSQSLFVDNVEKLLSEKGK